MQQSNGASRVLAFFDGDSAKLRAGDTVQVEGETVAYTPNLKYPYDGAQVRLRLASGRTVEVRLSNGYLSFEGGDLPILNPDYPLPGDLVRIEAHYSDPQVPYGEPRDPHLHASYCRSTWLLKCASARVLAFEAQRKHIAREIERTGFVGSPPAVRTHVSALMRGALFHASSSRPCLDVTAEEVEQLKQAIHEALPDPRDRPLDLFDELYTAEEVNRVYGVDVYAMDAVQFYAFCLQVGSGTLPPVTDGSVDYPFRLMWKLLPDAQEQEILVTAVKHFYPEVVGKRLIFAEKGEDGVKRYDPAELADSDRITFNTLYIFERALGSLSRFTSVEIARLYLGLAKNMEERQLFCTDTTAHCQFCEFEIFQAMESNAAHTAEWKDREVVWVVDPAAALEYIRQLPLLRALYTRLCNEGWRNRGARDPGQHCASVIDTLERIDRFLKPEDAPLSPGMVLEGGRYLIVRQLGSGGMGAVYLARDTKFTNRRVAVKEMGQRGLSQAEAVVAAAAFRREADMLASLNHVSLPQVYDHFREHNRWYLVMQYIEGETLEGYLQRRGGTLPLEVAAAFGLQLSAGLAYLHGQQPSIIFRDLKPANIMVTPDERLYLIDFGIARHFKAGQQRDTIALGSPGYAAPEQYGRQQTSARSDIYSLGVVLHQLLSGNDPTASPFRFAPLSTGAPALDSLVARMLDLDEQRRPQSMQEVRQVLLQHAGPQK